jgi:hypothetical protein
MRFEKNPFDFVVSICRETGSVYGFLIMLPVFIFFGSTFLALVYTFLVVSILVAILYGVPLLLLSVLEKLSVKFNINFISIFFILVAFGIVSFISIKANAFHSLSGLLLTITSSFWILVVLPTILTGVNIFSFVSVPDVIINLLSPYVEKVELIFEKISNIVWKLQLIVGFILRCIIVLFVTLMICVLISLWSSILGWLSVLPTMYIIYSIVFFDP